MEVVTILRDLEERAQRLGQRSGMGQGAQNQDQKSLETLVD